MCVYVVGEVALDMYNVMWILVHVYYVCIFRMHVLYDSGYANFKFCA